MADPVILMEDLEIEQGLGKSVDFNLTDSAGAVIDMTDGNKELTLVMQGNDPDTTGTSYVRVASTSTHQTWRTQAQGKGTWIFLPSQTFTAGEYDVAVQFDDSADTGKPVKVGSATYTVVAAEVTVQ